MKNIYLIGGGNLNNNDNLIIHNEIFKNIDNPKILYIPAASKDSEVNIESFKSYFLRNYKLEIDVLLLYQNTYAYNYLVELLNNYNIIYFGGGTTKILYESLVNNNFKDLIKHYINTKVFVGLSAGGIVLSNNGYTDCDSYYDRYNYYNFKLTDGLGILDITFVPHYQNLSDIAYLNTMICLEEKTCIHIIDDSFRLIRNSKNYTGYMFKDSLQLLENKKINKLDLFNKL